MIYFTFCGGYEGAVKMRGRWRRISPQWGSIALHQWAKENGESVMRMATPDWAYTDEYKKKPLWMSTTAQRALARKWVG